MSCPYLSPNNTKTKRKKKDQAEMFRPSILKKGGKKRLSGRVSELPRDFHPFISSYTYIFLQCPDIVG